MDISLADLFADAVGHAPMKLSKPAQKPPAPAPAKAVAEPAAPAAPVAQAQPCTASKEVWELTREQYFHDAERVKRDVLAARPEGAHSYTVRYYYLTPGPAGPFTGVETMLSPVKPGERIEAPFGAASVISCSKERVNVDAVNSASLFDEAKAFHHQAVATALRAGKDVPQAVLADYPDLQPHGPAPSVPEVESTDPFRKDEATKAADIEESKRIIRAANDALGAAREKERAAKPNSLEMWEARVEISRAWAEIARANILSLPFTGGPNYEAAVRCHEDAEEATERLIAKKPGPDSVLKAPWELTRAAWIAAVRDGRDFRQLGVNPTPLSVLRGARDFERLDRQAAQHHEASVTVAFAQGQSVPADVLADYPGLAPAAPAAAETEGLKPQYAAGERIVPDRDVIEGDIVSTADGQLWFARVKRGRTIPVCPIVAGKPVINADTARSFDLVDVDVRHTGCNAYGRGGQPTLDALAKPAAAQPRRGEVGGKLASGEVVLTRTGRATTPFPPLKMDTERKAANSLKAVDRWLMQNALDEAKARGDEFNALQFEAALKAPQQADKDAAEEYLFGDYIPPVLPSILKPLAAAPAGTPAPAPLEPVALPAAAPAAAGEHIPYELPGADLQAVHDEWAGSDVAGFVPNARQQRVIDAVARALAIGLRYARDVEEHVAAELRPSAEQRALGLGQVSGGAFGMDCFYARRALEARGKPQGTPAPKVCAAVAQAAEPQEPAVSATAEPEGEAAPAPAQSAPAAPPADEVVQRIAQSMHDTIREQSLAKSRKSYESDLAKGRLTQAEFERRMALDRQHWERCAISDRTMQLAKAIAERDPRPLVGAWAKEGQGTWGNEGSMKAFELNTGIKLRRLSSADRAKALFTWAGWSEEQVRADVEQRRQERAERLAERERQRQIEQDERTEDSAQAQQIRIAETNEVITLKAYIDGLISQGYDRLTTVPQGAAKKTVLVNEQGAGYVMSAGLMRDYADLAVRRAKAARPEPAAAVSA